MGLQENLHTEKVTQLSLRDPVTTSPVDSLRSVVDSMQQRQLGCAIVIDEKGKPLGMFTEHRLIQLLADETTSFDQQVSDVMTTDWPSVTEDDPIVKVLDLMKSRNVRFIIVTDRDGRLKGLTGQKGLLEYVADHFPEQVMVQRIGGTPHLQSREGA